MADKPVVYKKGWLLKKADFVKNWRKRFFVISSKPPKLAYFKDVRDTKPRAVVPMLGAKVVRVPSKKANLFAFQVSAAKPRKETYRLAAPTPEDRDDWIAALQTLASGAVPSASSKPRSSSPDFLSSTTSSLAQLEQQLLPRNAAVESSSMTTATRNALRTQPASRTVHAKSTSAIPPPVAPSTAGKGPPTASSRVAPVSGASAPGTLPRPSKGAVTTSSASASGRLQATPLMGHVSGPVYHARSTGNAVGGWGHVQAPDRINMIDKPLNELLDQAINYNGWRLDTLQNSVRICRRAAIGTGGCSGGRLPALAQYYQSKGQPYSNFKAIVGALQSTVASDKSDYSEAYKMKGSCVIPAPAHLVFRVLLDLNQRDQWDSTFERGRVVENLPLPLYHTSAHNHPDNPVWSPSDDTKHSDPPTQPVSLSRGHSESSARSVDDCQSPTEWQAGVPVAYGTDVLHMTCRPLWNSQWGRIWHPPRDFVFLRHWRVSPPVPDPNSSAKASSHNRAPESSVELTPQSTPPQTPPGDDDRGGTPGRRPVASSSTVPSPVANHTQPGSSSSSFMTMVGMDHPDPAAVLDKRSRQQSRPSSRLDLRRPSMPVNAAGIRGGGNGLSGAASASLDSLPTVGAMQLARASSASAQTHRRSATPTHVRSEAASEPAGLASSAVLMSIPTGAAELETALRSGLPLSRPESPVEPSPPLRSSRTPKSASVRRWGKQGGSEQYEKVVLAARSYSQSQSFVIVERSVQHPDCPPQARSNVVRGTIVGGGWVIHPTAMHTSDQPSCVVSYIADIRLNGWVGRLLSAQSQTNLVQSTLMARVAGLREYVRQVLHVDPRTDQSLLARASMMELRLPAHEPEEDEEVSTVSGAETPLDLSVLEQKDDEDDVDLMPKVDLDDLKRPPTDDGTEFGVKGVVRASDGGLKFIDKEELKKQKGVVSDLLRSMGRNLMDGRSPINISLPVRIFESRSFLERITDTWCYAPLYLSQAGMVANPLERMKLVITFLVAGLHRGCSQLKPFNPILGETNQATYEDGSTIFCEQISHHPPISKFEVTGPRSLYRYYGHHEYAAAFQPNGVLGKQLGPNVVEFLDGTRITFNMPFASITGVMWGERLIVWTNTVSFRDNRNKLGCDLVFNPDKKSGFSRLYSSQKTPIDTVRGTIYKLSSEYESGKRPLVSVEGSWLVDLKFDGTTYWKMRQYAPCVARAVPEDKLLPSDCRLRADLVALRSGDEDEAQRLKEVLEKKQRADRKLRALYGPATETHH